MRIMMMRTYRFCGMRFCEPGWIRDTSVALWFWDERCEHS